MLIKTLKIFLPYTFFLGIAVAIFVSNFRPHQPAIVTSQNTAIPKSAGETKLVHHDPVCHMESTSAWGFSVIHRGRTYYFCSKMCRDRFAASPDNFLAERCLVCNVEVDLKQALPSTYLGKTYHLCSHEHRTAFNADPASYFMHTMWGIPSWMYYVSISFVLVVSFGLFEWLDCFMKDKVFLPLNKRPFPARAPSASAIALPILSQPSATNDRLNLLHFSLINYLAKSRVFRFVLQFITVFFFFLIIAAGLFGNQNPALNIAPIMTWTIWWGGLVILIMFAGKAWCYICPWDTVAFWMEKLRFWKKSENGLGLNLKWPKPMRNIVIATLLFVGLTWVELGFGVTMKPRVTAYLAIGMLLMAIVSAFLFEGKGFCRYACLVGRVSGLYAMFSGVEVRAKDSGVCRTCKGHECVQGSEKAYGCPVFLYPGHLKSNTYCIQCAECIQACPEDNLTLNMRPWGADLVSEHKPRTDEAHLALLMLSITGFHGLTMTSKWGELNAWLGETLSLGKVLSFSIGMTLLMFAPIAVYALLIHFSYRLGMKSLENRKLTYHDYFIRYAYALLPIALFYHLAHNMEHLLMEGPKVISMLSDPFGWGWNLFGTSRWTIPPLVSLDVLWIVQIVLVLVGHVYSLWVAQRTSAHLFGRRKAALYSQFPMLFGMICFSVFSLWLLKQPMEMRTSAM